MRLALALEKDHTILYYLPVTTARHRTGDAATRHRAAWLSAVGVAAKIIKIWRRDKRSEFIVERPSRGRDSHVPDPSGGPRGSRRLGGKRPSKRGDLMPATAKRAVSLAIVMCMGMGLLVVLLAGGPFAAPGPVHPGRPPPNHPCPRPWVALAPSPRSAAKTCKDAPATHR